MRTKDALRHRVIAACVLLALVIGGVFAAATYVLIESVEHRLIDQRMSRVADRLMEDRRDGVPSTPPIDLRFVSGVQLPDALRTIPAGMHELELNGRLQHALILDEGGERFALIDDESDFEQLEGLAQFALVIGLGAGVLLAIGIGRGLASRVIAPVTHLARAVERDDLSAHPALLASADEIGRLARAFDARTTELQRVLDRERLFTSDVSHELRTPLTVMLGAAELLAARLGDRPDLRAAAERIRRNAADTAARVSALLQLARAPEAMACATLDLCPLVRREVERCRPLLQDKPVELHFEASAAVWVRAPAEVAAIAIDNLLRNACLFTQQGKVTVRLVPGTLVVEDTGPGVPAAVRARLFGRHVRASGGNAAGSGHGLSIVQRVAEHLGWQLHLEDNPGGGSRFTVRFTSEPHAGAVLDVESADRLSAPAA